MFSITTQKEALVRLSGEVKLTNVTTQPREDAITVYILSDHVFLILVHQETSVFSFCSILEKTVVQFNYHHMFKPKSLSYTFFFFFFPTVTEKVYESESYSETEDDHQATKQAPKDQFPAKPLGSKQDEKKSQKKSSTSANKGTKQASIMGFFQKK